MTLDSHLFEQVADAVRSLLANADQSLHLRVHRRGVKAWFGDATPPREHYEAQVIARRHVDGLEGLAVEVGFHAEHKDADRNQQVIAHLLEHELEWRDELGVEAEVGVFLGVDNWRRVSEVWIEPDLDDPDLAFEMAARLVDYLTGIEPLLSSGGTATDR